MKTDERDIPEDISALAREYGQAAIQVLVDIMNDKDVAASTRVAAAKAILERGFGKPVAQAKERPRAAPVTRMERAIVDHNPPENRPEPEDASDYPAPRRYGQPSRPPVRARHDRQPGNDRLAQPP